MPSKNQQCTTPLRLPVDLKEWAKKRAAEKGLSLNGLIIALLQRERVLNQKAAE